MDYSTNVLIINKTRWTITGTYKHKWGTTSGALPGTIPPGKTSATLTANPPNVFHGAEGTYTLHLEGEGLRTADTGDTTIVFREGCPRGAHNYWYFLQGSPLVRVDARIGHGKPTNAVDWGSPSLGGGNVGGGDVLGIQITITEQPPVKHLSVLTYNSHLFKGSPADVVIRWINGHGPVRDKVNAKARELTGDEQFDLRNLKPMIYQDDERQTELIRRLQSPLDPPDPAADWPPDIVCLQEVWDDGRKQAIRDALLQTYPYCYIPPNQGYKGSLTLSRVDFFDDPLTWAYLASQSGTIPEWIRLGKTDRLTNSSGLMVLSKFPIFEPTFQVYEGATKIDDMLAKKGAVTFRVHLPLVEGGELFEVMLGTTHAFVPTAQAEANAALLAQLTFAQPPGSRPDALLLGDFNIGERGYYDEQGNKQFAPDGEIGQEYRDVMATMNQFHAKDVVEEDPGSSYAYYYTDWQDVNTLTHRMEHTPMPDPPDPNKRDRIDYVFFRPGDVNHLQPLGASGARVFHDWKVNVKDSDGLDVSDHMPVLVEFAVFPSAPQSQLTHAAPEPTLQPVE